MQRVGASTVAAARLASASRSSRRVPSTPPTNLLRPRLASSSTASHAIGSARSLSIEASAPTSHATAGSDEARDPPTGNHRRESPPTPGKPTSLDDCRSVLLAAALHHVHEHGWTEDAIAAGVVSVGLPPSTVGLAAGGRNDLVSFFMEKCNDDLREILRKDHAPAWDAEKMPVPERIERALRARLEMVAPYVRSGRWHEAMAIGASSPSAAAVTAGQLDAMARIVADAAGMSPSEAFGAPGRAAIGAAYGAAELHLLADESEGYVDTWTFLGQRVKDLETMAGVISVGPAGLVLNSDAVVAASAVTMSLGGAVLSLARPAATGAVSAMASTIVPQIMTFMQQPQQTADTGFSEHSGRPGSRGTKSSDYDLKDLPPFEAELSPSDPSNPSKK